jgi:transposase-like protein
MQSTQTAIAAPAQIEDEHNPEVVVQSAAEFARIRLENARLTAENRRLSTAIETFAKELSVVVGRLGRTCGKN